MLTAIKVYVQMLSIQGP